MDKVGVFLCSGCGIGDALDLDAVAGVADENGAATTLTHPCLCEAAGLEAVRAAAEEQGLNGILLAACSDRAKVQEFAALPTDDRPMFRICLREHCTWSHPAGDEDTQMLAEDLMRMGMARIKGMKKKEVPDAVDMVFEMPTVGAPTVEDDASFLGDMNSSLQSLS